MADLKICTVADFIVTTLKGPLSILFFSPVVCFPVCHTALWHHTCTTFQFSHWSVLRISAPLKCAIWIWRCSMWVTEEGENLWEAGWGELVLRALWQSWSAPTFQVKYSGRISQVLRRVCGPITSAKGAHKETIYFNLKFPLCYICSVALLDSYVLFVLP